MVLCVYFMWISQNGSQQGFDYSAQHTVGGQRLGINVSYINTLKGTRKGSNTSADMLYGTVTEADVSDCAPAVFDAEMRKGTQNVLRRRRILRAPPLPHTHTTTTTTNTHTIFIRTQHNTLESKLHEKKN